jgi:hypothetical protein
MPNRSRFSFPVRRLAVITAMLSIGASTLAGPASAATGPYQVKDINLGGSSNPTELTSVSSAGEAGDDAELWMFFVP